jgi:Tfp pilus assembly protein PilO
MDAMTVVNKYKNTFVNLIVFVVGVAIAFQVYKNQAASIAALEQKKEMEIKKNVVLKDIKKQEKIIQFYKDNLNKEDMGTFIVSVNEIAKQTGVKIVSLKPNPTEDVGVARKSTLALVISSDNYHKLGKFINAIETLPDFYYVDNVSFTRLGVPNEPQFTIEAQMVVATIFFKG